ncbi:MAG: hypothetical protein HY537_00180 [Deltaproteobacteria bacterium]|nr:hypothetical protein [Deltaproteobacteria bacterium]
MKKVHETAKLVFREKLSLQSGLLRDEVIWKIPKSERYPEGIRYCLALVDPTAEKVLVLFDNHHPKGHHRHFQDGREEPYQFDTVEQLIKDYLAAVDQEERNRESKKD